MSVRVCVWVNVRKIKEFNWPICRSVGRDFGKVTLGAWDVILVAFYCGWCRGCGVFT